LVAADRRSASELHGWHRRSDGGDTLDRAPLQVILAVHLRPRIQCVVTSLGWGKSEIGPGRNRGEDRIGQFFGVREGDIVDIPANTRVALRETRGIVEVLVIESHENRPASKAA